MKKTNVDSERYLYYYNKGLNDVEISKLMGISNSVLSRFRNKLKLPANRIKLFTRKYKEISLTEFQSSMLIGTVLGDASIELNKNAKSKNARLCFGHSIKQKDYMLHKIKVLEELFESSVNEKVDRISIKSISHPVLTYWYHEFYFNNIKSITDKLLENLNPISLAYLFMDDGSRDVKTNAFYISLCAFSIDENYKFMKLLMDKFSIKTTLHKKGLKTNPYFHIYINASSRGDFIELIEPYIVPSMRYKIGQ